MPRSQARAVTLRLNTDFPSFDLRTGDHVTRDEHGVLLQRHLTAEEMPAELVAALDAATVPALHVLS